MKIRYVATGVEEHVQNSIGQFAIKTGLAVEVPPAVPKPIPNLQWHAREGKYLGIDFQFPPYLFFKCLTCGVNGAVENVSEGFVVRHCGITEKVPSHIRENYDRLMKDYRARSRRRPSAAALGMTSPEQDRIRDAQIARELGIKSSAQLKEELRQQIAAAGRK